MNHEIKDIAVYTDPGSDRQSTLDAVARFGSEHGARVTGIYVIPPLPTLVAGSGEISIPLWVMEQYTCASSKNAAEAKQSFENAMNAAGASSQWRMLNGDPATLVAKHFRYADVGVVTQPNVEQRNDQRSIVNYVLLNSGRLVLVIPYIGAKKSIGHRVIVGWNGGVECTRALHDAMPVLSNSEWVEVLSIDNNPENDDLGPGIPIAEHLTHHGVVVTATSYPKTSIDPGNVLINHANDRDADMIIAGAWGHARATEFVFGGTTRTLLEHMTVPVWMSH